MHATERIRSSLVLGDNQIAIFDFLSCNYCDTIISRESHMFALNSVGMNLIYSCFKIFSCCSEYTLPLYGYRHGVAH